MKTFSHITAKVRKLILILYHNSQVLFKFLQLSPNMHFVRKRGSPKSRSCKTDNTFSYHVSLVSFYQNSPWSFLDYHKHDTFNVYRPFILHNVLQCGFVWCFFMIRYLLYILGRNTTQAMMRSHFILFKWHMIRICTITGDINFNHLFKFLSAWLLHCEITFNKYFVRRLWDYIPLLIKLLTYSLLFLYLFELMVSYFIEYIIVYASFSCSNCPTFFQ